MRNADLKRYRATAFEILSFITNTGYGLYQGVLAALLRSVWLGALSSYYIILSLMKGGIILFGKRRLKGETDERRRAVIEYRVYVFCGIMLNLMSLTLIAAVTQMVLANRSFSYAGLLLFGAVVFTVYKIIASAVNLIQSSPKDSPITQSARNIGLVGTIFSALSLSTALISAFGDGINARPVNIVLGAAVIITSLAFGIYMVISGSNRLKRLRLNR